jgi:dihydrofolate synthase/folylpolyglutamate synthase
VEIDNFLQLYKQNIEIIEATFFETLTAMACWYFKKENVEIAIMETGLGGRLDSASICRPLATVITPVSLDHVEILGETLREIAVEKAGAMKKDVPCLSARQRKEAAVALQKEADRKGTPLYFLNGEKRTPINVNIPGEKQKENTELALLVLDHLNEYTIPDSAIRKGLKTVLWHGRNQMLQRNPTVIFDVAHNADGLRCFLDYYQSLRVSGKSTLVLALYLKKRIEDIVPQLENVFQHIICTQTEGRNPMPADILATHFGSGHSIKIIKDSQAAIRKGLGNLSKDDGMAILGTHCLGPAVNKLFKISFDNV